jgi:hypothetical protein
MNTGNTSIASQSKEKVVIDKKTYEDIMNYLIRMECRRLEKDKIIKRPGSGLKRQ